MKGFKSMTLDNNEGTVELFQFDIVNLRSERQEETVKKIIKIVEEGISDRKPIEEYINQKELDRLLKRLEMSERDLFAEAQKNPSLAITMTSLIAKLSSRQSSKDETFTLNGIDRFVNPYGIRVNPLSNNHLRPAKDGKVYSKKEYKKKFGNMINDVKTIDFEVESDGKLIAWGSHKYCLGHKGSGGGHQGNVFNEEKRWLEWGRDISEKNDLIYIALVDTNIKKQYDMLKQEFDNPHGNLWVVNHVELQKRLFSQK